MSCGIVVCSKCRREIHQTGTALNQWGWTHCEDGTDQCKGGERDWAQSGEPKGKWCGRDHFGSRLEAQPVPATIAEPAPPNLYPAEACTSCGVIHPEHLGHKAGCPQSKEPAPPVECPARKALKEIAGNEWTCYAHTGDEHTDCAVSIARAALSAPCSPCPECAERQSVEDKLRGALECATAAAKRRGAERDSLRQKVEKLTEALRPFAEASVSFRRGAGHYAEPTDSIRIVLAQCDRAASALSADQKGGERP